MVELEFYMKHVKEMREAARLSISSGLDADIGLHTNLYAEELFEHLCACAEDNLEEKADALADILVVACGYVLDAQEHATIDIEKVHQMTQKAADRDGIILHGAFLLVHESNMSKLCTDAQVEPTRLKYAEQGVLVEFKETAGGLWSALAANSTPHAPIGKWLKGVGYHAPNWGSELIWLH